MFHVVLKCILQILKVGSLFGELNNLFMKIAFLNATSSHTQKSALRGYFLPPSQKSGPPTKPEN
jgi:hypothetical protein